MLNTGLRTILLLVGFAATLGGCSGTPSKVWSYDEKAEADRGSRQHVVVTAISGTYPRDDWSEYVTTIGNKLAAASERPNLTWRFTVLDSPKPDAFATRGGYVYITRGMLALLRSESDLAAVLAHEIAHISTQDTSRAQTRKDAALLGTLGTALALAPVALLVPQVTFAPAGAAIAAYTRHDELEADRHGADYLRRAGYVPESMSSAMTIIANIEAFNRDHPRSGKPGKGWTHRAFADHPSPDKRQGRLGQAGAQDVDPQYLARLEGMEFALAKSEGIPDGQSRYFPQWDVLLDVPQGWRTSGSSRSVWVSRESGKGSMHLESVGTGATGDLCEALASFADGASLVELEHSSEGGVESCKGLVRQTTRNIFGPVRTTYRVGIVAPADMPGARFFYREYRMDPRDDDPAFMAIARSVRALGATDDPPKPPAVRIRKVQEGDTFASLAKAGRAIPNAESVLRLINLRYPGGELEPGQLVKVIE